MADCGYNDGDLTGSPVYFDGGRVGGSHPHPVVKIKESVEGSQCGFGGSKSIDISIEGELVCCDPVEKVSAASALESQFSNHCGDFSTSSYSYNGCRVQSLDVSQSNYRDNVSYSVSLVWVDPDYPSSSSGKVTDVTDSIQSSENDDSVTVTHTVSASAAQSSDCDSCGCDLSDVQDFVNGRISSSCPTPQTISLPGNKSATGIDCPEVSEDQDDSNCSFSVSKTWTILKNLDFSASSYGPDLKVTKCRQVQYDTNQKQTITISGNISWEAAAGCQQNCGDALDEVKSALESEIQKAKSSNAGKKANEQKSWNDSFPPSANYSVTFPPDADDDQAKTKDNYTISISFGSDGVGTVTVSGSCSANQQGSKTSSENCLCEDVDAEFAGEAKYRGEAMKYYNSAKGNLGDALKKLQGPCAENNQLNPKAENSEEGDCEGGSKSFSYTYTDKAEKDAQWNYSVNVSKPIEKVSIKNTLGGGYCVHRSGECDFGTASVNGSRSQNCPKDPDFDTDALALGFAQDISGANNLEPQSTCSETVNGDQEKNTFNKSYKYEGCGGGGGNAPGGINVPPPNKQGFKGK